ncbi:histidine phosphatase family protein, partial [Streptomyces sp. NPDC048279]
ERPGRPGPRLLGSAWVDGRRDGSTPAHATARHGAAIRLWAAARADNVDVAFAAARPLGNTGVVVLEGSPADVWKAVSWEGSVVEATGESGPAGEPVPSSAQ